MDNLEENYKIEKNEKIKKIMDIIIIITIYNSFIHFLMKNLNSSFNI